MSNNALRTARKVWKQVKYNLGGRSVLELGSADDDLIEEIDAGQTKEIDADQIEDIEKAINEAIRTLMATGSWPAGFDPVSSRSYRAADARSGDIL